MHPSLNAAIALIASMEPRSELEAIVAVQIAATAFAGLKFLESLENHCVVPGTPSRSRCSLRMLTDLAFDPPLVVRDAVLFTLGDAVAFARSLEDAQLPKTREAVVRLIQNADTRQEQLLAANSFRAWTTAENSLLTSL